MKPGHGEVLIAEGDATRAEDEQRLIEEFRRQLDAGLWAAVPVARGRRGVAIVPGELTHPVALPLREAPQVAPDLGRIELAAGQVHVRGRDQPPFVTGQRHPLRQHVVRVGQAARAVRARLVRERDAVLVEQAMCLGQVGEDRPVGVDQVGVRGAAGAAGVVWPVGQRAPHPEEAEVVVHRPLLLVDARAQERAGTLLGPALAAGVIGPRGRALSVRAEPRPRLVEAGDDQVGEQRQRDEGSRCERQQHGPESLPAARRPREEDHALGVTRDLLEGLDHLRLATAAPVGLGHRGPEPRIQLTAKFLDQSQLILGDLDVAFGQQHLTVAGLHPQEAHPTIMSRLDFIHGP